MKNPAVLVLFLILPCLAFHDHTHYSQVFGMDRSFRVFTPDDYNPGNTSKRYPVIFYCNGCGGTYTGDSYRSYSRDGGYPTPYNFSDPVYDKPFNADFEGYSDNHDVIVVTIDGKLYGAGGCDVYYPYINDPSWTGSDFNYSEYLDELIGVVDSLYNTYADPLYRAVTGLSFGGHSAIWLTASNPDMIRSGSHFSHSPPYWAAGPRPNTTRIDVTQLWRNFRGLSFRTSTNDQDYLMHYSRQVGNICQGAGFENDFHMAHFWRHWAADIDSQFDFHMSTFGKPRPSEKCFSFINLYPDFHIWNYQVTSQKAEEGWIYLKDVTRNSLGIYSRLRLPFGKCLSPFDVNVLTAPKYQAGTGYTLVRYRLNTGQFATASVTADAQGRLAIAADASVGEEIGITGPGQSPEVSILPDTTHETLFLRSGADTALSFEAVNLSETNLTGVVFYTNTACTTLTVLSGMKTVDIPAKSRVRIDSLAVVRADFGESGDPRYWNGFGFLKISMLVNGLKQDKEQFFQVQIIDTLHSIDTLDVQVFDGRSDFSLPVYNFTYGAYNGSVTPPPESINEGTGNGDGVPDSGEVFSVWIRTNNGLSPQDSGSWHPTVPIHNRFNPDVTFLDINEHRFNRGRHVLSAQIRFNRTPTWNNPITFPVLAEFLDCEDQPGSDYGNIDAYRYRYFNVIFPFSAIGVEDGGAVKAGISAVDARPNPFNPAAVITVRFTPGKCLVKEAAVYSPNGRRIRTFIRNRTLKDGKAVFLWNGTDDAGRRVAAGVYLLRVKGPNREIRHKLVYLP